MILENEILCECDECGEEEQMSVSVAGIGFDVLALRQTLKQSGWTLTMDTRGYRMKCAGCSGT